MQCIPHLTVLLLYFWIPWWVVVGDVSGCEAIIIEWVFAKAQMVMTHQYSGFAIMISGFYK